MFLRHVPDKQLSSIPRRDCQQSHACSEPWSLFLQTHRYGCAARSPPPKSYVPSPHRWKSKRRKNKHFAQSMRHYWESGNLQGGSIGTSEAGTFSFLLVVALSISSSSQVQFDFEMEVGHVYSYWRQLIVRILLAAWPARYRGRTRLHRSRRLCFSRLPRIRGWRCRRAGDCAKFCAS